MADTHINAFYAEVEEKKQDVIRAQGELEAATLRLTSHPDYKPEEVEKVKDAEPEKPAQQNQPSVQFKKR